MMTEEELNHLHCIKAENALLVKHNKDLMASVDLLTKTNGAIKVRYFELQNKKQESSVPQYVKGEISEYRKDHYVNQLFNNNKVLKRKVKELNAIRDKYVTLINKQ